MSAAKADPVNAVAATKARTAFFMMPPKSKNNLEEPYANLAEELYLGRHTLPRKHTRGICRFRKKRPLGRS
jgi:hypothetical protein